MIRSFWLHCSKCYQMNTRWRFFRRVKWIETNWNKIKCGLKWNGCGRTMVTYRNRWYVFFDVIVKETRAISIYLFYRRKGGGGGGRRSFCCCCCCVGERVYNCEAATNHVIKFVCVRGVAITRRHQSVIMKIKRTKETDGEHDFHDFTNTISPNTGTTHAVWCTQKQIKPSQRRG